MSGCGMLDFLFARKIFVKQKRRKSLFFAEGSHVGNFFRTCISQSLFDLPKQYFNRRRGEEKLFRRSKILDNLVLQTGKVCSCDILTL